MRAATQDSIQQPASPESEAPWLQEEEPTSPEEDSLAMFLQEQENKGSETESAQPVQEADQNMPDWLDGLTEKSGIQGDFGEDFETPEISEASGTALQDEVPSEATAEDEVELPDWLKEMEETSDETQVDNIQKDEMQPEAIHTDESQPEGMQSEEYQPDEPQAEI